MAEARTEDEEESLRESRGGGGRNPRLANASSERAERNKPEQRLSSQGALSSIRAVIKRTSNRTTAQTDHSRDRRRPEITILSAEPLATNWFPGASGAFPPPPPPPAQPSWASGGLTVQLPPPSYEQVIREKSREQSTHSSSVPSASSSSSSSSTTPSTPPLRRSTSTIATQTDTGSSGPKKGAVPPACPPPKPPRPTLPLAPKPAESVPAHTHTLIKPDPSCTTSTHTRGGDILSAPLSEQCGVQTDFTDVPDDFPPLRTTPTLTDSSHITNDPPPQRPMKPEASARPRPRPRSKAILPSAIKEEDLDQAMTREVKVQTLVRLKDDGGESVFAGFTDDPSDISSNKYLQELLDVFGFDEQGFPGKQDTDSDQSEKSEEEEETSESCVASSVPSEPSEPLQRPQPRPRTFNPPKPAIAPKPSEPPQEVEESKSSSEEHNKPSLNPPVPAPRPLLTNKSSERNRPDSDRPPRPPVAARRSVLLTQAEEAPSSAHQTAAVPPKSSVEDGNVDEQVRNSSSAPVRPAPYTSANRSGGKSPIGSTQTQIPAKPPSQRRPPPPSYANAQVAVSGVSVSKAPVSTVPSLPPRPSEGRMLPLRPPPIKQSKSTGSSHATAASGQLPGQRVPKRRPPLPPRPKPGHPLYRDYTSKVLQGLKKMSNAGTEPEERDLQQKENLLVLDDTPTPEQTPSFTAETKGQLQVVCDDVCPPGRDKSASQQKQSQEMKRDKQKEQPNPDIRYVARFAFEGQEEELTFREGDVIALLEYVNDEWGRGSLDGHTGLFPLNFVQEAPSQKNRSSGSPAPPACEGERHTGRALYDFTPESEDELCLKVGDIVRSLEEVDEEWFMGEFAGKRGIIPKNYIQVL